MNNAPKFNIGDTVKVVKSGYGCSIDEINKVVTITMIGCYNNDEVGYHVVPPIGNSATFAFDGFIGESSFELVKSNPSVELRIKQIEEELTLLKEQLVQKSEEQPKWEPQSGNWFVNSNGVIRSGPSEKSFRSFGVEFRTEELAQKASVRMRKFNRMIAYVLEQDPTCSLSFERNKNCHTLYLDLRTQNYGVVVHLSANPCTVYMSEEVANKLMNDLNSGRVVL